MSHRPALFLDRDGVIIENRTDYVKSLDEVAFVPGAVAALAAIAGWDCRIVIVTNQSSIGRGLLAPGTANAINHFIHQQITQADGRLDGLYVCPHLPEAGCRCRKPAPGLLLDAAADLDIDLAASVMIGDAVSDVLAAHAVGAQARLVLTGRGAGESHLLARAGLASAVPVAADLAAALAELAQSLPGLIKTPPVAGGVASPPTAEILP